MCSGAKYESLILFFCVVFESHFVGKWTKKKVLPFKDEGCSQASSFTVRQAVGPRLRKLAGLRDKLLSLAALHGANHSQRKQTNQLPPLLFQAGVFHKLQAWPKNFQDEETVLYAVRFSLFDFIANLDLVSVSSGMFCLLDVMRPDSHVGEL